MALRTIGTTTTTALSCFVWTRSLKAAQDAGTLRQSILSDQPTGAVGLGQTWPGNFSLGLLYIPNRGVLQMLPGDIAAFDTTTGWPILISALAQTASGSKWNLV